MGDTVVNFYDIKSGNIANLYLWIPDYFSKNYSVDYFCIIYTYTILIFYCWFRTILFLGKNSDKKTWYLLCLYALFTIVYCQIMELNRIYFAFLILFFYFFYIREKIEQQNIGIKLFSFVFIAILTISIHSYSAAFFGLYFFSILFLKIKLNPKFILILIPLFIIGGVYSLPLLQLFHDQTGLLNPIYFQKESAWGYSIKSFQSVFFRNKFILLPLIFAIVIIAQNQAKNIKEKLNQYFVILLCLQPLFLLMYSTLFERSYILATIFSVYALTLPTNKKSANYLKYLLILCIVCQFYVQNFYRHGDYFTNGYTAVLPNVSKKITMELKPFYLPTFYLLNINNGYSDAYLETNVQYKSHGSYMDQENKKRIEKLKEIQL